MICGGGTSAAGSGASDGDGGARMTRCFLCGQQIMATCEEDCVRHMSQCQGFASVHPTQGETNFDYFNSKPGFRDATRAATANPAAEASGGNGGGGGEEAAVTADEIQTMGVKALKAFITSRGLSHADCIEKADLRRRAEEALAKS
mmetsp:Transcript_98494/g.281596  ORF Transcript_98494/g.281596 Transcript_98494/m.281596 type:complete len:146 (+) Transcript_98494:3-440(+)